MTNFLTAGNGLPEVGSQYVLFLWRSIPTSPEYEIIFYSGYQLKNGRVYSLDDVNSQYVGVDATVFLDEVRKAIASQKGRENTNCFIFAGGRFCWAIAIPKRATAECVSTISCTNGLS